MFLRITMGLLLALGLALPSAVDAATAKKSSKSSKSAKPATARSSSSSGHLRVIGDGPAGPFVAAPDQQVFINLGGLVYGVPSIGYERAISDDNSWLAMVGFKSYGGTGWSSSFIDLSGGYRWWLGQHAKMQGFYAGPGLGITLWNVSWDYAGAKGSSSATALHAGGEGGYQWIFPFGLTANAGIGAGFTFGTASVGAGAPAGIGFGGFGLGVNLAVGYAF